MEKKVTKIIVKGAMLIVLAMSSLDVHSQWTGFSPNPIWTNQSAGIGTQTPMKKLQIVSYETESAGWDNGATLTTDPLQLRLSFIKQSNYNLVGNVQNPGAPMVIIQNEDWDIDNNRGALEFHYTDNLNASFRTPFTLSPSGGTFHYDLGVSGNLNVSGTSTLQNASVTDLSTQNLIVNNSATFGGIGNEVTVAGKLAIGGGIAPFKRSSGSSFGNYALSVNGTIVSTRSFVQITSWADKVFQKNYKLMSLSEIEAFVTQYKHLPEIPSEAEVIENGVDVGEMNKLLLQKVEELTLHLIEQDKKIKILEAKFKKAGK